MDTEVNPNPSHWAGFDLAKATFQLGRWGHEEDIRKVKVAGFDRTRKGCKAVLKLLRQEAPAGARIGIVMEATGTFAEEVGLWLLKLDPTLHLAIVNPMQTSAFIKSLGLRNKTDDLDARALAQYGAQRKPPIWKPPSPEQMVLRDLTRVRADMVQARVAMALRLKDHKRSSPVATQTMKEVIRSLGKQIKTLEVAIQTQLKAHEELARQAKRLASIKGVALITAVTVLAEFGDLRRFSRSRQLTAFAGLSPKLNRSGTSVRGSSPICKQGSTRVRAVLYCAAASAARFNPDLARVYQHLVATGKHKRSALGAVMRKLLVLMRAVLLAERDWAPMMAA
jgi:transposase